MGTAPPSCRVTVSPTFDPLWLIPTQPSPPAVRPRQARPPQIHRTRSRVPCLARGHRPRKRKQPPTRQLYGLAQPRRLARLPRRQRFSPCPLPALAPFPPMTQLTAPPLAGHLGSIFEPLLRSSQRPLFLRLNPPHSRRAPLVPPLHALDPLHTVSRRDPSQYRLNRTAAGERGLGEYAPRGRGRRSCHGGEAPVPLEELRVPRTRAPRWRTGRYHFCGNREEGYLPPDPGAGNLRSSSTDGGGRRGRGRCGAAAARVAFQRSTARSRIAGVRSVDQGSSETEGATVRCCGLLVILTLENLIRGVS